MKMLGENKGGLPSGSFISLEHIFVAQRAYQFKVTGEKLPMDSVVWFHYHMTAMQEELGEVLKADKRWKTHRNTAFDSANKLEEIADVFITAINLALFSGFDVGDVLGAVKGKIMVNDDKWEAKHQEELLDDDNR